MESHPEDGEAPQMNGSMLVAVGESAEKVREQLAKDIYVTSGVWDFENMSSRFRFLRVYSMYMGHGFGCES